MLVHIYAQLIWLQLIISLNLWKLFSIFHDCIFSLNTPYLETGASKLQI
jgi:hypothetical protein